MRNSGTTRRQEVADFWDAYLRRWLAGDGSLHDPLDRWFRAYHGPLDLQSYPDPFVGDLRGDRHEPRIVVLGINPGVAVPQLQARGGLWAERVRTEGLSRCFQRSREEDPVSWLRFRPRSQYWARVMPFVARWVDRPTIDDVLAMELYPWHSNTWVQRLLVDRGASLAELARRFIFGPIAEVEVKFVFSFSLAWQENARILGLKLLRYEEIGYNKSGRLKSTFAIFELNVEQRLIATTNANGVPLSGSDAERLEELLRQLP